MPLIDWFTVVAQVINFLLLVWLMKRFLYVPILNAIDTREERISTELASADANKAEARKEQEEFKRKNEEFDRQRAALLNKAREEAKNEHQQLLEEARKAASDLSSKQQEALKNARQNLNEAISRRAQKEVFAIAQKALKDLAGIGLEERMVDVFIQRLHDLNDEEKKQFTSALQASSEPVLVRTAFELPEAQCTSIKRAIKEALGVEIETRFEISPDLISGIELSTNGQEFVWNLADYIKSLERGIDEVLKEHSRPEIKTGLGSKPEPEAETEPVEYESGPVAETEDEYEPGTEFEAEPKPDKLKPETEKRADEYGT